MTGLTEGQTYGIKMRAINEVGHGPFSDIIYLACADLPATPSAPTNDSSTSTSITVSWNEPAAQASSAPVTGYNIYMNDLSVGEWVLIYEGLGYPTR